MIDCHHGGVHCIFRTKRHQAQSKDTECFGRRNSCTYTKSTRIKARDIIQHGTSKSKRITHTKRQNASLGSLLPDLSLLPLPSPSPRPAPSTSQSSTSSPSRQSPPTRSIPPPLSAIMNTTIVRIPTQSPSRSARSLSSLILPLTPALPTFLGISSIEPLPTANPFTASTQRTIITPGAGNIQSTSLLPAFIPVASPVIPRPDLVDPTVVSPRPNLTPNFNDNASPSPLPVNSPPSPPRPQASRQLSFPQDPQRRPPPPPPLPPPASTPNPNSRPSTTAVSFPEPSSFLEFRPQNSPNRPPSPTSTALFNVATDPEFFPNSLTPLPLNPEIDIQPSTIGAAEPAKFTNTPIPGSHLAPTPPLSSSHGVRPSGNLLPGTAGGIPFSSNKSAIIAVAVASTVMLSLFVLFIVLFLRGRSRARAFGANASGSPSARLRGSQFGNRGLSSFFAAHTRDSSVSGSSGSESDLDLLGPPSPVTPQDIPPEKSAESLEMRLGVALGAEMDDRGGLGSVWGSHFDRWGPDGLKPGIEGGKSQDGRHIDVGRGLDLSSGVRLGLDLGFSMSNRADARRSDDSHIFRASAIGVALTTDECIESPSMVPYQPKSLTVRPRPQRPPQPPMLALPTLHVPPSRSLSASSSHGSSSHGSTESSTSPSSSSHAQDYRQIGSASGHSTSSTSTPISPGGASSSISPLSTAPTSLATTPTSYRSKSPNVLTPGRTPPFPITSGVNRARDWVRRMSGSPPPALHSGSLRRSASLSSAAKTSNNGKPWPPISTLGSQLSHDKSATGLGPKARAGVGLPAMTFTPPTPPQSVVPRSSTRHSIDPMPQSSFEVVRRQSTTKYRSQLARASITSSDVDSFYGNMSIDAYYTSYPNREATALPYYRTSDGFTPSPDNDSLSRDSVGYESDCDPYMGITGDLQVLNPSPITPDVTPKVSPQPAPHRASNMTTDSASIYSQDALPGGRPRYSGGNAYGATIGTRPFSRLPPVAEGLLRDDLRDSMATSSRTSNASLGDSDFSSAQESISQESRDKHTVGASDGRRWLARPESRSDVDSLRSLGDDVDYSRPIGGMIRNRPPSSSNTAFRTPESP